MTQGLEKGQGRRSETHDQGTEEVDKRKRTGTKVQDRGSSMAGRVVTIRTYRPIFIYLLGVLILES